MAKGPAAPSDRRHRLSLAAIAEAAETIDPLFTHSPILESQSLSDALGCHLILKLETENPIRSFKGRGADYFLTKISDRGDERPLVCASTGNFGQAMAYACQKHDRPLVVYADLEANRVKTDRIGELGGEVRLIGGDFDQAKAAARDHARHTGSWMIEDGREPEISEGAGSIAVELLREAPPLDAVLIAVGNGALITGNARWIKANSAATAVMGVSASGAPAMAQSWELGRVVEMDHVETIAEGIAVRIPVPEAVDDMRGIVDDFHLVDDESMIAAMRLVHEHCDVVIEPAGVVGVALIMKQPGRFAGRSVATILTGANVTDDQRSRWLG